MTKPQSSSRPCRSTCAATSKIYYSTISECEQTGEEKHSLKEWKYPWPHLQCVQVCVGVSVPPHPALHTPLPAIRRSGLTGRKIISCFHQLIHSLALQMRFINSKCQVIQLDVYCLSTALFEKRFLYFAEVIMLTLALVLHAVFKHRILGHLFYSCFCFFHLIFLALYIHTLNLLRNVYVVMKHCSSPRVVPLWCVWQIM